MTTSIQAEEVEIGQRIRLHADDIYQKVVSIKPSMGDVVFDLAGGSKLRVWAGEYVQVQA